MKRIMQFLIWNKCLNYNDKNKNKRIRNEAGLWRLVAQIEAQFLSNGILDPAALNAGRDLERLPVFGDCPPGNINALCLHHGNQFIV